MRRVIATLLLLVAGCQPELPAGVRCDPMADDPCPSGYVCCGSGDEAVCLRADTCPALDAGPADAGAPDAGPLPDWVQVAAGLDHTCALHRDGRVLCWGDDDEGEVSAYTDGERGRPIPVRVDGVTATAIAAGGNFTCALVEGGARCWGANQRGMLGGGSEEASSAVPVAVSGLPTDDALVAIDAGDDFVCARTVGGAVYCWGENLAGQLGRPSTAEPQREAARAEDLVEVEALALGGGHACARRSTGEIVCWGSNFFGQLGRGGGDLNAHPVPMMVAGLLPTDDARWLGAGPAHTCAGARDGPLTCWGLNGHGQLGDGTTTGDGNPVTTEGLPGGALRGLAGGGTPASGSTCAWVDDAVHCWGRGTNGQLGNGASANSSVPVRVQFPGSPVVTSIALGGAHACATTLDGVLCWGNGDRGQLGNGQREDFASPQPVMLP